MQNEFLSNYEKLNKDGKFYIDCAMKAALSSPAYLLETPQEDLEALKQMQEAENSIARIRKEMKDRYYEELKAECDTMTVEDYRQQLNELFASMELYKLRYFYIFINAKLYM